MKGFHFYSKTEYTSPSWVKSARQHLPINTDVAFSPGNSLELTYNSFLSGDWYSEIQYCPVRGNDFFRVPDILSFQLYSETDLNETALPQIAIRYKNNTYTKQIKLTDYIKAGKEKTWHKVSIPLKDLGVENINDSNIKTLAAIAFYPGERDGKQYTLYIDDMELLPVNLPKVSVLKTPELKQAKAYERHIDIVWTPQQDEHVKYYRIYRSLDGTNYTPVAVRRPWLNRFADFVGKTGCKAWYKVTAVDYALNESAASQVVSATTSPMTDEQLLDMVQEASFRYYWEGTEPESGLARENIPGRKNMIATGASGFGIMATIAAVERGYITREEAVERFVRITSFLEKADKFHGAVAHFIDGTTGKTEPFFGQRDNGADLVETSFLFQGLLAAHQYFNQETTQEKQIRKSIDTLWKNIEWNWFKRYKDSPFLYWHWSPDQEWIINHRLIGWNETMITYLLAIMGPKHGVSPEMYYTGWASPSEYAQEYRIDWGKVTDGSMYTNGNTYFGEKLKVGVSNGGPLFFVHYSYMGLNPHQFTDRYVNYFENNRKIALINYRYCVENQGNYVGYGEDCWGLTASDFTWNYQAQEPMPHRDNGTIAPTGALASFPYTPEESMRALKNYYRNFGEFLWGEYGFRDACNLTVNWCSPLFMGLNQAPVTVMIENYRSGLIWNLFMSHPDVKKGIEKIEVLK
ncbi:glucoamylase family protein [Parabacteroides sp. PF5-9]|uniref:glucoamylase family protein n=1 Tax=Parabacteroides sp. PF5-9 TaxID=1742404 RepID=UPI0032AFAE27